MSCELQPDRKTDATPHGRIASPRPICHQDADLTHCPDLGARSRKCRRRHACCFFRDGGAPFVQKQHMSRSLRPSTALDVPLDFNTLWISKVFRNCGNAGNCEIARTTDTGCNNDDDDADEGIHGPKVTHAQFDVGTPTMRLPRPSVARRGASGFGLAGSLKKPAKEESSRWGRS